MKLYRAKVPQIAKEVVDRLVAEQCIEVKAENREEAERDLAAIMDEYLRRDSELREQIRDHMPLNDDVERFLCRQFIENMMISPHVEEVFEEDRVMYKKVMEILKENDVDENEIREEAASRIKNVAEGTVDYELALQDAVKAVKKRRGLI
jgi:hypothetical protein